MPNDLLGRIHSSTDTTSPDWATFRSEVTGTYLLSGQGGEWGAQHLIREYNRNINSLYKSWTPTEPNATGLFVEPYNAGFSYQGTGDFRNYKWDTYSLDFDGVDDYVDTNLQPDFINTNATISVWCKMDNFGGSQNMGCHNSKRFYLGFSLTNAFFGVQDSYKDSTSISSYIAVDTWMHIALVANGGIASYYVNGVVRDTMSYTQSAASNPDTNFYIGAVSHGVSALNDMEGKLDEVAIFDSALSAAQVLAIYNGGTPQSLAPYSPFAWWRMGDWDVGYIGNAYGVIIDQMNLTLGSDLITNGDFATDSNWTKGAGWAISDGVASSDGSQSSSSDLYQNAGLGADGTPYQVTFTVSNYSAGNVRAVVGGANPTIYRSANGTYTERIWVRSGPNFYMQSDANFIGSIGDVVVKEINGYAGGMNNMTASDIVADTP